MVVVVAVVVLVAATADPNKRSRRLTASDA